MNDNQPDYTVNLTIEDIRLLYHCVEQGIKYWPGSPARPVGEQERMWYLRDSMYRMILDYQFNQP